MIIIPSEELMNENGNDLVKANRQRISRVKYVMMSNLEILFDKFKDVLDKKDIEFIKQFLEKELFFENIIDKFASIIYNIYSRLEWEEIIKYIEDMKSSYKIRGHKGFRFALTPVLRKYMTQEEILELNGVLA